jgi:hypothetical protein
MMEAMVRAGGNGAVAAQDAPAIPEALRVTATATPTSAPAR